MRMSKKAAKALRIAMTTVSGILGFVLFRWTPATVMGLAIYVTLLVLIVGIVLILGHIIAADQRAGYWPKKPESD
jgi:hypothetical protein